MLYYWGSDCHLTSCLSTQKMFSLSWCRLLPVLLALAVTSLPAFQKPTSQKEEDDDNFDRPLQRWHYFYDQRQSSATEFPEGGRLRASRVLDQMDRDLRTRKSNARAAAFSGTWKAIGPQPIAYLGPAYVTSGRVTSLVIDPRSNDIVYAGGANGGVWKSSNGGRQTCGPPSPTTSPLWPLDPSRSIPPIPTSST